MERIVARKPTASGAQAGFRPSWFMLLLLVALAGCSIAPGESESEDPEAAQVSRLVDQGFSIVSDGRGENAPTTLRYEGDPAAVITCQSGGGRFVATDQTGSAPTSDGRFVMSQAGEVAAYVIVVDSGGRRGLYVNHVLRTVTNPDGRLVARQLEKIEFPPTGTGRFRNGVTCQAKS